MEEINVKDIVSNINGTVVNGRQDLLINNVFTDSRKDVNRGLFVCLKGENTDGHKYIDMAIENGAVAVIISQDVEYKTGITYIKVKDTMEALKDLAKWYRERFNVKVVGVTGSVGKTTTKDMIAAVLSKKYNTLKTEGNLNSETGVPFTVFNINKKTEMAVIEMGMDGFGQIRKSSSIAKPDVAVITNIGISHIEHLKTRENILKAKCEILENLSENGAIVLNHDDDMLVTINSDFKKIWIGTNNEAEIYAKDTTVDYTKGEVVSKLYVDGKEYTFIIPGLSKHLVYAALFGVAVGIYFNIDITDILDGIKEYKHTKMRMDIKKLNHDILLIDDTYNASPQSMKSVIDTISNSGRKNIVAILGDMFELGDGEIELHKDVIEYAKLKCTRVLITGNNMKKAYDILDKKDNVKYYDSKDDLCEDLRNVIIEDSIVAVKASRGIKFETIVEKMIEMY